MGSALLSQKGARATRPWPSGAYSYISTVSRLPQRGKYTLVNAEVRLRSGCAAPKRRKKPNRGRDAAPNQWNANNTAKITRDLAEPSLPPATGGNLPELALLLQNENLRSDGPARALPIRTGNSGIWRYSRVIKRRMPRHCREVAPHVALSGEPPRTWVHSRSQSNSCRFNARRRKHVTCRVACPTHLELRITH